MNSYIPIETKEVLQYGSKISISVLLLVLNEYALIKVQIFDSNSKLLDVNEFILEGEDYSNWHNDNYLIDYVCQKYGYVLKQ